MPGREAAGLEAGVARGRGYMSQLDGLRFMAIMAVLVAHDWKPGPGRWISGFPFGDLGVRLFFVLSGFLITGILLRGRERLRPSPERRLVFVRQFYIRRFLRIFPLYYVVLFAVVLAGVWPARHIWPWLFTYTTNLYVWQHQHWIGYIGHFWSLAVEEQFYLVWPWLVVFLPRRWLVPILLGLVCLAPVYRLYAAFHYSADIASGGFTSGVFPVAVFDSLGLGALLALAAGADRQGERLTHRLRRFVLPIGAVGWLTLFALSRYGVWVRPWIVLGDAAAALIFCWLVGSASHGFGGVFGRLLEWRPIAYLGKISYGIYIFHNLVPVVFGALARRLGIKYEDAGLINFIAGSLVAFGLAAVSWHVLEARINALKRYFPYATEPESPVLASHLAGGAMQETVV